MFRLGDLQTDSHFFVLVVRILSYVVFNGKGVQDVFVVFCLVVVAQLVGHDHCTSGILCLTSFKVIVIERIALQIEHP